MPTSGWPSGCFSFLPPFFGVCNGTDLIERRNGPMQPISLRVYRLIVLLHSYQENHSLMHATHSAHSLETGRRSEELALVMAVWPKSSAEFSRAPGFDRFWNSLPRAMFSTFLCKAVRLSCTTVNMLQVAPVKSQSVGAKGEAKMRRSPNGTQPLSPS